MTRQLVRREWLDAILDATTAHIARTDPLYARRRAEAAAALLYRIEPAADRGAAGPSPTAATPRVVVGDTPKERTEETQ